MPVSAASVTSYSSAPRAAHPQQVARRDESEHAAAQPAARLCLVSEGETEGTEGGGPGEKGPPYRKAHPDIVVARLPVSLN